jgi:hypothetical protein
MTLASRFFRWHRWLGYLVALQVLAWVAGGVLFAWLPFQAWVKVGRPCAQAAAGAGAAGWSRRLAAGLPAELRLRAFQAVATAARPGACAA